MRCPSCRADNDDAATACHACRTPLVPIGPGSFVAGRYEVRELLGRGGMGTVYRAYDRVLEDTVALKILRADVAQSPEMARRFRSEIKLARRVSHWNVCRIYEYGEDAGLQYISMELIEGENLKESIARKGPPPVERAYELSRQIAEGLAAIHKAGVVHRDLKTPNIMVDGQGVVRVMDFGIARAAASETGTGGVTGYVLGSPEYMSPEQARGRTADLRSDVYAFGVVVFEIFSGRVPFRAETPVATLLMHLESEPPLQGPGAPPLPPPLVPFLRRALAKDPADRYADADEAARNLRLAREASLPDTAKRSLATAPAEGRWRSGAHTLALAILLVVANALVLVQSQRRSPPAVAATPVPADPSSPPPVPVTSAPAQGPAVDQPRPTATPSATMRAEPSPRPSATLPPNELPPTALPTPMPSAPTPAAAASTPLAQPPVAAEPAVTRPASAGALLVTVAPWAHVDVDGVRVGTTPLRAFSLSPGTHTVLLTHPGYQPYPRKITIRSGETFRLAVDLPTEGVRRR